MPTRAYVRTRPIAPVGDLGPYLGHADVTACWVKRGYGLVGFGLQWRRQFDSPLAANTWWLDLVAGLAPADSSTDRSAPLATGTPDAPGPVAFISCPFDPANTSARCELVVPRQVIIRRPEGAWLVTWEDAAEPSSIPSPVTRSVPAGDTTRSDRPSPPVTLRAVAGADELVLGPTAPLRSPGAITYRPGELSDARWCQAVTKALEHIAAGDVEKVVLARSIVARAERPIEARWLLTQLQARYPNTWTFAVAGLIGATPELLVRRDRGLITSRVLAGTIHRSGHSDAEDLAQALASSSKDLAEHEYAVASVAEALAPYCSGMNVPESPFVLRLPNVMHLATDITGVARTADAMAAHRAVPTGADTRVEAAPSTADSASDAPPSGQFQRPGGASVLELAAAVHPSAAVCGTPTAEARRLIQQLEGMDRGRYAGPVGWIGASGDGDIGIALRCGQLLDDPHEVRLLAGCGIVADSEAAAELAETEAKLLPLKQALGA